MENTTPTTIPSAPAPALDAKTLKDLRTSIIMGFVLAVAGVLLNAVLLPGYPLQSLLLGCVGPVLMLLAFLMFLKGKQPAATGCAAAYLALRAWNFLSLLMRGALLLTNIPVGVASLIVGVMLVMMARGKLQQKGFAYALVAVCALISLLASLAPLFQGYSIGLMDLLRMCLANIGALIMTLYGFALILNQKQYKRFTVVLGIVLALVIILSVAAIIMTGGFRVDNAPQTNLEEAQEWVYNNFRVDNDGNLFWD